MVDEKYPVLLWAASVVFSCAQCKRWLVRSPKFMGDTYVDGFECEYCGATSVHERSGRPFGPKSKQWDEILWSWSEYHKFAIEMIEAFDWWDVVKTDPPLRPGPDVLVNYD